MPNFGSGRDAIHNLIRKEVKLAMTRLSDETETAMFLTLKKMLKAKEESLTDKILDPLKLMNNPCLFVFGLEGDSATINFELARAIGIVTAAGGIPIGPKPGKMWYKDRFKLPYLRDTLLDMGIGSDTFETSTNWKNLPNLYDQVMNGLDKKFGSMNLSYKAFCHISHSYHDGASLYFTFFYPLDLTAPVKQWWEIKEKCCELLVENGGTISHHHGVGRDHSPWLRQEKTDLGYKLLEQTKACFDPNQVMNPDKLLSSE